jgi:hypothetical protein
LIDNGYDGTCGTVAANGATLHWVIEKRKSTGGWKVVVFRASTASTATAVLHANDPDGSEYTSVNAFVEDISGDGGADIAFGFHLQGSGAVLSADVVEGPGTVTAHRDYAGGGARLSKGRFDGYGATPGGAGPTAYTHEVMAKAGGTWRITSSTPLKRSEVPASQI